MYISIHYQIEKLFFPFTAVQQRSHVSGTCTRKRFVEFVDDRLGWIQLRLLFCFARRSTLYANTLPRNILKQICRRRQYFMSVRPCIFFSAGPFWIFHVFIRAPFYFFDVNLSALVDSGKFYFLFSRSNSTHSIDFSENCTTWNSTSRTWLGIMYAFLG
jgi:hypothetical protein